MRPPGNGRTARILQSLVLARAGVLSLGFASIEAFLAASTGAYYDAVDSAQRGSWEDRGDASSWLAFCLDAHLHQARARTALLEAAALRWARLEEAIAARGRPDGLVIALGAGRDHRRRRPRPLRRRGRRLARHRIGRPAPPRRRRPAAGDRPWPRRPPRRRGGPG